MKSQPLRSNALILILLLAGSEAFRVQQRVQESLTGPESAFQQENCSWSWWRQSCEGAGCKYRAMFLDTPSQWCRLSDEHMLKNNNYFELQNNLLNVKANKFAAQCQGLGWYNVIGNAKCKRRMIQMMRATKFLAKAEAHQQAANMTDSQQNYQHQLLEGSIKAIAQAAGPDGQLVLDLLHKMENDANATQSDPGQSMAQLVNLTMTLLHGSDAQKAVARDWIRNSSAPVLAQSGVKADQNTYADVDKHDARDLDAPLDDQVALWEDALAKQKSTESLVQVKDSSQITDPEDFEGLILLVSMPLSIVLVTMMLVHLVGFIAFAGAVIAWLFFSMVGCSVASFFQEKHLHVPLHEVFSKCLSTSVLPLAMIATAPAWGLAHAACSVLDTDEAKQYTFLNHLYWAWCCVECSDD